MHLNIANLSGEKFNRLKVLSYSHTSPARHAYWLCKCDCGNEVVVAASALKRGLTKSCGCLRSQRTKNLNLSHGLSYDPTYATWKGMVARCYNEKSGGYKYYGGRGITVCDEWRDDPAKFIEYVSQLPKHGKKGYTIDRINNDGNYEPGNIRYATKEQQTENSRTVYLSRFY